MKATLEIRNKKIDVTELVHVGTYGGFEWDGSLDRMIDDEVGANCELCDSATVYGVEYYSFFSGQEFVANLIVKGA